MKKPTGHPMHAKVAELVIHPIKSCRGASVPAARVGPRGLEGDRRYMLVDADGRFLTQREHPRMALIDVTLDGDAFRVTSPGRKPLVVPRALDGAPERPVRVWRSELVAAVADDGVNGWFSEYLGFECSLVYMADRHHRAVTHSSARDGDEVGFADDAPLLLISTASLADLNARLEQPVEMRRFRPNLVVTAERPFAEDDWGRIRIGDVELDFAWPCTRCVLTTVDPETGAKDRSGEPLRTLATFRRVPGGVSFGQNLLPRALGRIAVGDEVEVLGSFDSRQDDGPLAL